MWVAIENSNQANINFIFVINLGKKKKQMVGPGYQPFSQHGEATCTF